MMTLLFAIAPLLSPPVRQAGEGLDLHGRVLTEAGEPIADASVFVYTAKLRKGTSPL